MSYWLCPPHSAPLCIKFSTWQRWGHDMLTYFFLSTPLPGKSHGDFRPVFYSPGVAFYTVAFRTEPSSHRQEGESISKLLPDTSTCQGTTNSYFHSHISWVKSIPFKITALTFEPFRQTASGSTLFFCWKKRKKDPWHVINRARLISKSEWHPLLNNELQIFCYKSLNTAMVWEDSERIATWFAWALIL